MWLYVISLSGRVFQEFQVNYKFWTLVFGKDITILATYEGFVQYAWLKVLNYVMGYFAMLRSFYSDNLDYGSTAGIFGLFF